MLGNNFKTFIFFLCLCFISLSFSKELPQSSFLETRLKKTESKLKTSSSSSSTSKLTLNSQTKVHSTTSTTSSYDYRRSSGFACFFLGLILFPLSICCIFHNERMAVKDTYFTDLLENKNVREFNAETLGTENINNQLHIYRGKINLFESPKLGNIMFEDLINKDNFDCSNTSPQNNFNSAHCNENKLNENTGNMPTHNGALGNDTVNNNLDETNVNVPPTANYGKKVLAYKIETEDWVRKEENRYDDGRVEINNIWRSSHSNDLKDIGVANFNFDGKLRITDNSIFDRIFILNGKSLQLNDEVIVKIQEYFNQHIMFKGLNVQYGIIKFSYYNNEIYACHNKTSEYNSNFSPDNFVFCSGDKKVQIKYILVGNQDPVTLIGDFNYNSSHNIHELCPHETGIKQAGFFCIVNCEDSDITYKHHFMTFSDLNKKQLIHQFHEENSTKRWVFRFLGWFIHFISVIFIMYPVFFILNFIPIIGALSSMILIFAVCLCTSATFIFLLVLAWIVARPVIGILLITAIIGLIVGIIMLTKGSSTNQQQQSQSSSNSNNTQRRRFGFF